VTISHGISNLKRDKVTSVAEAAQRTANAQHANILEDDITSWLSGPSPASSMTDTQTIRLDDTNAAEMKKALEEFAQQEIQTDQSAGQDDSATQHPATNDEKAEAGKSLSGHPEEPGKLPRFATKPAAKDSCEAAAAALRSWNRH
jgi:hypothetical protein